MKTLKGLTEKTAREASVEELKDWIVYLNVEEKNISRELRILSARFVEVTATRDMFKKVLEEITPSEKENTM